jgi:alpha-L-rhamnosidase
MINNGATTTWENWNRDRSRIHNCYNGIGYWFYHALAGIRPDENAPGYRHFFVEPQIPADMEWVNATKNTPYGDITVSWKKEKSRVELKLTVPVGTTATIRLGDIEQRLGSGKHILRGNL